MITFLHGKLVEALPTQVIVEVNGVGYEVLIPLSSFDKLPAPGGDVKLLTHLAIREDAHVLYGFMTATERDLFRLLINTVSGIGPKIAWNILSGVNVTAFRHAVANSDFKALSQISGVGKKTAERIVVELRDKIGTVSASVPGGPVHTLSADEQKLNDADASEGAEFLAAGADDWAPNSMFAFHLWWHKALFHIDANDVISALKLYDENISAGGFGQALELLDGSALLWRLSLLGHDVGARWTDLADKWETRVDHAYYAFNDVSAMMAFVGAGRANAQQRLIAAAKRAAAGRGTNAMMSCEIGVPACEGFAAFGRGDYARTIELLMPLRAKANRMGGSHAQRDMFSWTLTEAAIRLGDHALADAFVAERLSWKPESPINRAWAIRADELKRRQAV